jgi:cobalamin biosynthesis protein CobT
MTARLPRTLARTSLAAALALAAFAGCSSDDSDDTTTTVAESTTTADGSTSIEEAEDEEATDDAAEGDETTTTEAEESSGELDTVGVLDHLNENAPELGALFDWNTGDGIIGVDYLGTQTVSLYAAEIDADTALAACEAASDYVFGIDPEADLKVYTGGLGGTLVASRSGEAGSCAAS